MGTLEERMDLARLGAAITFAAAEELFSDWDALARGPYRALYDEYADAVSRVLGRKVLTIREHCELIEQHWRSQPAHNLARRGPRPDWWEGDYTSV
jgi:hypothetical protein